jgi:hypothetical protein
VSRYYSVTFGKAIARAIGAPYTQELDIFLRAWAQAESGTVDKAGARWNPLNATVHEAGSTDFNSNNGFPVQNYATWQDGVTAISSTLLNGKYPDLVDQMRGGKATGMAKALVATPWGTGALVSTIVARGGPRAFPIGACYPTPPASYHRGVHGIQPGSIGPDVDEVLRHLGNTETWYVGSPVLHVIEIQKANPQLGTADGIIGPVTFKFLTGHA